VPARYEGSPFQATGVSIWNIFLFFSMTLLQGNRVGFLVMGVGPSAYTEQRKCRKDRRDLTFPYSDSKRRSIFASD